MVLIPSAAASATDAAIQKKIFESGMTTLIVSNKEMDDIIKKSKPLENSGLLTKIFSETINKANEQRGGFHYILLDTLGASLLENLLIGKEVVGEGEGMIREGCGTIRAG